MSAETELQAAISLVASNDKVRDSRGWSKTNSSQLEHLIRNHGAELLAALRDAERMDALQHYVDDSTEGMLLLHNGAGVGLGILGLGLKNTGRTLREAVAGIEALQPAASIGRRKAVAFFAKRLLLWLVILYFAIASYGRFYGAQP